MFGRPIGGRGELGLPELRIGMLGGAATMMEGRGATGTGLADLSAADAASAMVGDLASGDLASGALLWVTGEMAALMLRTGSGVGTLAGAFAVDLVDGVSAAGFGLVLASTFAPDLDDAGFAPATAEMDALPAGLAATLAVVLTAGIFVAGGAVFPDAFAAAGWTGRDLEAGTSPAAAVDSLRGRVTIGRVAPGYRE